MNRKDKWCARVPILLIQMRPHDHQIIYAVKNVPPRNNSFNDTWCPYFTENRRAPAASTAAPVTSCDQPGGNQVNPRLTLVRAGWTYFEDREKEKDR